MDPFAWGRGVVEDGATLQVWDSVPFPFGSANCGKEGGQKGKGQQHKRESPCFFPDADADPDPVHIQTRPVSSLVQSLSYCVVLVRGREGVGERVMGVVWRG